MVDYMIKLVWPEWVIDPLRSKRVGFSSKYSKLSLAKGCRMLIYVTEHQLALGVYTVSGTYKGGEKYPKTPGYPYNVPLTADFEGKKGLTLHDIRNIVPEFQPVKDMSFHPLDEEEFTRLEEALRRKG